MTFKEKMEKRRVEKHEKKRAKELEGETNVDIRGTFKDQMKNLWFAYKYIYNANKMLLFIRIPLLLIQSTKSIVPVFFVREILNEITEFKNINMVVLLAVAMATCIFILELLARLFKRWDRLQREKFNIGLKKKLAESVMEINYSTLENPEIQDYLWLAQFNRFDDVLQFTSAVIGSVLTAFGISAIVFVMNPIILLVIVATSLVVFFTERYQVMLPHKFNDEKVSATRENAYYSSLMSDRKVGKEIRVNNLESWIYNKTETSWQNDLYPLEKKYTKIDCKLTSIIGFASIVQSILIYVVLSFEVIHSTMTVGDFSMYLTAAGTFSSCIIGITRNCSYLVIKTSWYLRNFRRCLIIAERAKTESGSRDVEIKENAEIEFRNVSFKYPQTDIMILENVNLKIKRGETLSVVGLNGAGKTTFVKLLCRFYEPTSGEIYINGIPAKDIKLEDYYKLFGVVFQDFSLFSFTVAENISMETEADEQRLFAAIKKSGLEKRVQNLPHGVDTFVFKSYDPDGIELSGGEGQKVAIARAVYREAPIVIFDEPTSALDPIAEYDIYKNFHDLAEKRTAIYISHRMSSTRFTDHTAVFANKTIAEYGTHDELMAINGGVYREMFEVQAKYYAE